MIGTRHRNWTLALLTLLAAGCGLKGPLRLPDEAAGKTAAPASSTQAPRRGQMPPAPQSQKKDRELPNETNPTPPGDTGSTVPPVSPPDPDRPANTTALPPPGR